MTNNIDRNAELTEAYAILDKGVYSALETYSNVHRGSGHFSMVTTHLFEQARDIILEYLGLNKRKFTVIFCTPLSASKLIEQLDPESYQMLSSHDLGLSLGVRALAVKKRALPHGSPVQSGGGTARLIAQDWVVWAVAPERFEAGTPAIVNIIAFARVIQMIMKSGNNIFLNKFYKKQKANEIIYRDELEKFTGLDLLNELRKTLIGSKVKVPTTDGLRSFINLDYAASTPTFFPVWNAVRQTWQQPEKVQREIVQEVRSICANFLGAPLSDYETIFTSNTTEAINLAAESLSRETKKGDQSIILTTILEHSSNDLPWRMTRNHSTICISADKEGFLDLNELEKLLRAYNKEGSFGKKRIELVAISGASNVLGTYNDLTEISRIVHQYGAYLLVDAAQLVAHREVDMKSCGIDYLSFSAHKVYAPFGSGALLVRKGMLRFNDTKMELIQSSGEENVGGIAALGKALVLLKRIGMEVIRNEEQLLTRKVLSGMLQINGIQTYGVSETDSPNFAKRGGVVAFTVKGKMSDKVAKELALQGGIGVRNGCHCTHVLVKHILGVGPKLEQFQRIIVSLFPRVELPGVVRVSFGIGTREEDIDTLIRVLKNIAGKDAKSRDKESASPQNNIPVLSKSEVQKQIENFVEAASHKVYYEL